MITLFNPISGNEWCFLMLFYYNDIRLFGYFNFLFVGLLVPKVALLCLKNVSFQLYSKREMKVSSSLMIPAQQIAE